MPVSVSIPPRSPPPPSQPSSSTTPPRSTQIPLRRPTLSHSSTAHPSIPLGGHGRVPSVSSPGGGGGGGRAEARKVWVVLGKKGRGFGVKRTAVNEDEEDEEDEWVTVGLERNIQAQIFSLAHALQLPVFPNLALEMVLTSQDAGSHPGARGKPIRARITGEEMWSTLFHQFLYPTSTPPQPLAAYSPLPIAAVLELRMLSAAVAASLGPPGAESQTADPASSKAKEAWKGGVRQLSLLAGRPKAPSAESGLHDAVHRWKSLALPPLSPTVPTPPGPHPALALTEPTTEVTPPDSPYDPASYSRSISSYGPPSPIKTPTSGWESPQWNAAVSVHMDRRAQGSVCLTPSTATSWGAPSPPLGWDTRSVSTRVATPDIGYRNEGSRPCTPSTATSWGAPSPPLDWETRSVASYVYTPDIGYRNEGLRPCTPSTATSWGAPSPPLGWELRSPVERVQTPSLADRVALTPIGLDSQDWASRSNRYASMTWLDLEATDGSARINLAQSMDWNSSPTSADMRAETLPLNSPPSSAEKSPTQRAIRTNTSPSTAFTLPLSPPRTLESPERANPATPLSAGGSLISRRKAAPPAITVPAQKGVLGVVVEKKSLPGMDLAPRLPRRLHRELSPVAHVVPSSIQPAGPVSRVEAAGGQPPPMPVGAVETVKEAMWGHAVGLVIAQGRSKGANPVSNRTIDPAPALPGIHVSLSDNIAYPFADGIYPPGGSSSTTDAKALAVSPGPGLVLTENALLSGVLDGLDRTKETEPDSAGLPLFRFGFPYIAENRSVELTPRSPTPRSSEMLCPAPASAASRMLSRSVMENGALSGVLDGLDRTKETESANVPLFRFGYPFYAEVDSGLSTPRALAPRIATPRPATIRILRVVPSYPISSDKLYPPGPPASRALLKASQAKRSASYTYPVTSAALYPPTGPKPIRILKPSTGAYPITSALLYPPPAPQPFWTNIPYAPTRPSPQYSIRILRSPSKPSYPIESRTLYPPPLQPWLKSLFRSIGPREPGDVHISYHPRVGSAARGRSVSILRAGVARTYPVTSEMLYPAPALKSIRILQDGVSRAYPVTSNTLYPPPLSRSIRILRSSSGVRYPLVSKDLYPPPVSRSLKILRSDELAFYPLRSRDLYPHPISRSLQILRPSPSSSAARYPLQSKDLYPPPISRSLRILREGASTAYPLTSASLYPSPPPPPFWIAAAQAEKSAKRARTLPPPLKKNGSVQILRASKAARVALSPRSDSRAPAPLQPWAMKLLGSMGPVGPGNEKPFVHVPRGRVVKGLRILREGIRVVYPLTSASLYPVPTGRSLKILKVRQSYPLTSEALYPVPVGRSIEILRGKAEYPIRSKDLYPPMAAKEASSASGPRRVEALPRMMPSKTHLMLHDEVRLSSSRKTPRPLQLDAPPPPKPKAPVRRTKTHLMLHLEVVRTLLLSPAPSPIPSSPPPPQPRRATITDRNTLGRTPSLVRTASHLPTGGRPTARPMSTAPAPRPASAYSSAPTVPHLPSSIRNSLAAAPNMSRSMSTRGPVGRSVGLEPVLEGPGLSRSVSQTSLTPARRGGPGIPGGSSRPMSRYDGLPSADGPARTAGGLNGSPIAARSAGGLNGSPNLARTAGSPIASRNSLVTSSPRTAGGLRSRSGSIGFGSPPPPPPPPGPPPRVPPPSGPPPTVPLPDVPGGGAGRRERGGSIGGSAGGLVSQRMSMLLGNGGSGGERAAGENRRVGGEEGGRRWM